MPFLLPLSLALFSFFDTQCLRPTRPRWIRRAQEEAQFPNRPTRADPVSQGVSRSRERRPSELRRLNSFRLQGRQEDR
jgi:hypothetical protein